MGINLYDKHLVYSLASVFMMVPYPAFSVVMLICLMLSYYSYILALAASNSHGVISGTSFGSL